MRSAWLITLFASAITLAQSPMDMAYSPMMLTSRPDVKKELKLDKEQAKQIDEVQKQFQKSQRAAGNDMQAMMGVLEAMKAGDAKIWEILNDSQDARLRELTMQARGPNSILQPEVVKELGLTEEQLTACKSARSAAQAEAMQALRNLRGAGQLDKIDEKFMAAIQAALKPEQWTKFQAMFGKPFKNIRMKGMYF